MGLEQTPVASLFGSSTAMVAKNKLPHGLTVYELKEMTKARLQAEAAEKLDGELHPRDGDGGGVSSPLDFEVLSISGAQSRERAMSRDSASRNNNINTTNKTTTIFHPKRMVGSDVVVVHPPVPHVGGLSPTLGQMNRSDTWDSASVASYNSNAYSENFGSESAIDVSFDRGSNNRARSFTVPSMPSTDGITNLSSWPLISTTPSQTSRGSTIGTPIFFDAAVGGNRRRAVTLSPGTGSILEDEPHHGTWTGERLQLPTFGVCPSGNNTSHASRQRVYSPVLEQLGLDGPFAVRNRNGDHAMGSNLFGSSSSRNRSDFGHTSLSSSEFNRESCITESRVPAPPPGFSTDTETRSLAVINHDRMTTSSYAPHSEFSRAAYHDNGKNPWEGVNPPHCFSNTVDNLSSDLGSILNLSGSDCQNRNRASTYTYGYALPVSLPNNGRNNAMEENNGMESFLH
jgi:hypothetical protein